MKEDNATKIRRLIDEALSLAREDDVTFVAVTKDKLNNNTKFSFNGTPESMIGSIELCKSIITNDFIKKKIEPNLGIG